MRRVPVNLASMVCLAYAGLFASLAPALVPSLFPRAGTALAADPAAMAPTRSSAPIPAPRKPSTPAAGPQWNELNGSQRAVLEPIAPLWNDLGEVRKRKWLVIARNYPSLPPAEQAKLHQRMIEWASLTRQQRDQARLNYQAIRKVPPDQRAAQWEAYQALSPEEKRHFAERAPAQTSGLAKVSVGRPVNTPVLSAVPRRHAALGVRPLPTAVSHRGPRVAPEASAGASGDPLPAAAPPPPRSPYEDEPAN